MTTETAPQYDATRQGELAASPTQRRTVSQTLCAATYVCEGFANYAFYLIDGRRRVSAPSITEDPVALYCHAVTARRLLATRDAVLCLIALTASLGATVQIGHHLGAGPTALLAATVVAGCRARRRLGRVLRSWCRWAWQQRVNGHRRGPIRYTIAAFVVSSVALLLILCQPVTHRVLGLFAVSIMASWLVIVGESVLALRRASAIVADGSASSPDLDTQPRADNEQRIAELMSPYIVVYAASRASTPFVGNGFIVRPWKIDIDVHRGRRDDCGNEIECEPVDIVAFHQYLEEQFQLEAAVENTTVRTLLAGHRLYVDGRKVSWSSDLMSSDRRTPRARVDWAYLEEELRYPEHAEDRRVYFYLAEISRGGEIGVSIFVRPLLHEDCLSIEFVPLVIPPLRPDIEATIAKLPAKAYERITRAVRLGTLATPVTMLRSPARCAKWMLVELLQCTAQLRWRLAARRGSFYDFGAVLSVREGISWLTPDDFDHFIVQDLIRINDRLRDRLVETIKAYLTKHGIDTRQLEFGLTIQNIQNWNVGNVRADMVSFGNANTFNAGTKAGDSGAKGTE